VGAPEYPPQDYYPSCKIRLIVRFEEFTGSLSTQLNERRLTIRRGGEEETPPQVTGTPQEQEQSADQLTHVLAGIVPRSASVDRNGVREADTLSADFKYADLPLDPRTIRSCAVECYMGSVSAEDFAAGLAGSERAAKDAGGTEVLEPMHLVPDTFTGPTGKQRSNLRFQGWVDRWEVNFSEDEPILSIECTDNTRQLIDLPAPPQLVIDAEKPIAEAVEGYLVNFSQFAGYEVVYLPEGGEQPVIGDVMSKAARKKGKGPPPGGGQGGEVSVWDYLTDLCGMVGHLIRFENTRIIVQRARALLKDGAEGRLDDPFVEAGGRTLASGTFLPRRLLVYGRNVQDMTIGRDFTRQSAQNVEIRSYNPETKAVIIGRHPPKDKRQKKADPGEAGEEVYTVFRVPGVNDEATLRAVAQDAYEVVNRNEVEVNVVTQNLASYGAGGEDPDLLDLLPGDPIDVEMQREEETFQAQTVENLEDTLATFQRGVDYMTAIGFAEDFAKTYVRAFIDAGLVSVFRTRNVAFSWDEDSNIEVEIQAVNYAVVERSDADLPEGEEP
jgi:hypothetical protein